MKVCFIGKLIFQLKGKLVTFNLLCCFNDDAGLADARTTTRRVERHGRCGLHGMDEWSFDNNNNSKQIYLNFG